MEENFDSLGNLLHIGDKVTWHDPDAEILPFNNDQEFTVVGINGEVVEIQNKHTFAEVFSDELTIVKT